MRRTWSPDCHESFVPDSKLKVNVMPKFFCLLLAGLLAKQPQLQHLMLHNIDTLGADADPASRAGGLRTAMRTTGDLIQGRRPRPPGPGRGNGPHP